MDNHKKEWYILEELKATTRHDNASKGDVATKHDHALKGDVATNDKGYWYSLEGESETHASNKIQSLSINSDDLLTQDTQNSDINSTNMSSVNQLSNTQGSEARPVVNESGFSENSSIQDKLSPYNSENDHDRVSGPSPSALRLNLQESVDGEISESQHSSSVPSSNSLHSSNAELSTIANDTNSLLKQAHDANIISFQLQNAEARRQDGLEWVNLTSSDMQDISRPEPLGLARTDPDSIGVIRPGSYNDSNMLHSFTTNETVSITCNNVPTSINSDQNQAGYIRNVHAEKTQNQASLLKDVQTDPLRNRAALLEDIVSYDDDHIHDLSYTTSILSVNESDKQPINKRAQDVDSQDYSSLASSLTMPSYKEISPKSRTTHETPITKLLGPSYKQTEKFLKDLKKVKLAYGSEDGGNSSDNTTHSNTEVQSSMGLHSSGNLSDSKNESCQVGNSQLQYANVSSNLNEYVQHNHEVLVEQDIASASSLEIHQNISYLARRDLNNETIQIDDALMSSASKSDGKRESDGELMLSELTDPLLESSKRKSSSSQSSKSRASSMISNNNRLNLEPIKEVLSPEYKNYQNSNEVTTATKSPKKKPTHIPTPTSNVSTYKSFKSGRVSSSSTPYDHLSTLEKTANVNIGIYDIRNSTSPGSSNRRRMQAGKKPRQKVTATHDPFMVYVSEDSKLTESVMSNNSSHSKDKISDNILDLSPKIGEFSSFKYTPDSRIQEISQNLHEVTRQSSEKTNIVQTTEKPAELYKSEKQIISSADTSTISTSANRVSYHTDDTDQLIQSYGTYVADTTSLDSGTLTTPPVQEWKVRNAKRNESYKRSPPAASVYIERNNYTKSSDEQSINGASRNQYNALPTDLTANRNQYSGLSTDETVNIKTYNKLADLAHQVNIDYGTIVRAVDHETKHNSLHLNHLSAKNGISTNVSQNTNSTSVKENVKLGSLNKLWRDFDETFNSDRKDDNSPVLKKLEALSHMLSDRKKKRASKINATQSSDSSTSFTDRSTEYLPGKTIKNKRLEETNRKNKTQNHEHGHKSPSTSDITSSSEDSLRTYRVDLHQTPVNKITGPDCPYCRKRSIGTNCPTPCSSDAESPLMLQTWTQTTPGNKVNFIKPPVNAWIELKDTKHPTSRRKERNKTIPLSHEDKENDKNLNNTREHLVQPARNDSLIFNVKDNNVLNKRGNLTNSTQKKSKEVPYTAWFHSTRSGISDIMPLSKVPNLNEHYSNYVNRRNDEKVQNKSSSEILTLQEAFCLHKQRFICRMKQRVQDVKDTRLKEKHQVKRKTPGTRNQNTQKKDLKFTNKKKREKTKRPRKIVEKNSPRLIHQQEEEKQALLRKNRLKMKQYDSKIRQRFLKSEPIRQSKNYYVERH